MVSLFSHFFAFFRLQFFASLRFSNFCFKAKQREAKFKSIFSLFFTFFHFFSLFLLFSLFSLNFRFASIFSLNFRLFYLRFRFRFLVFRIEVNHVKSGFFFASLAFLLERYTLSPAVLTKNAGVEINVINWENFRFEGKQSEVKFKSIFSLFFTFFSLFFAFFA